MTLSINRRCPVCNEPTTAGPNVHEIDNGYVYARDVDECSRCRRHWTSGQRRLVEHLSDAQEVAVDDDVAIEGRA